MRKVHGGRALLNQPGHHSTAVLIAEIEDTRKWPTGTGRGGKEPTGYNIVPNTKLIVSDCSQSINLELDVGTDARLENTLYKLDTMIATLRKVRKGVLIEHERLVKRQAWVRPDNQHGLDVENFDP